MIVAKIHRSNVSRAAGYFFTVKLRLVETGNRLPDKWELSAGYLPIDSNELLIYDMRSPRLRYPSILQIFAQQRFIRWIHFSIESRLIPFIAVEWFIKLLGIFEIILKYFSKRFSNYIISKLGSKSYRWKIKWQTVKTHYIP